MLDEEDGVEVSWKEDMTAFCEEGCFDYDVISRVPETDGSHAR